jgi:hypothetical protein
MHESAHCLNDDNSIVLHRNGYASDEVLRPLFKTSGIKLEIIIQISEVSIDNQLILLVFWIFNQKIVKFPHKNAENKYKRSLEAIINFFLIFKI